jgi:hypothetical protein
MKGGGDGVTLETRGGWKDVEENIALLEFRFKKIEEVFQ